MILEQSKIPNKFDVFIEQVDECVNCANNRNCALIGALQEGIVYPVEEMYVTRCQQFRQGGLRRIK